MKEPDINTLDALLEWAIFNGEQCHQTKAGWFLAYNNRHEPDAPGWMTGETLEECVRKAMAVESQSPSVASGS